MKRALLLLPLLAAACGGGQQGSISTLGCSGDVRLQNIGSMAVEQAYFSQAGPANWGRDLLAPNTLPPGAERVVQAAPGQNAVRLVFANGRAAEMPAMDVCGTPNLRIQPTELLPSR